jgi:hypothetical protein
MQEGLCAVVEKQERRERLMLPVLLLLLAAMMLVGFSLLLMLLRMLRRMRLLLPVVLLLRLSMVMSVLPVELRVCAPVLSLGSCRGCSCRWRHGRKEPTAPSCRHCWRWRCWRRCWRSYWHRRGCWCRCYWRCSRQSWRWRLWRRRAYWRWWRSHNGRPNAAATGVRGRQGGRSSPAHCSTAASPAPGRCNIGEHSSPALRHVAAGEAVAGAALIGLAVLLLLALRPLLRLRRRPRLRLLPPLCGTRLLDRRRSGCERCCQRCAPAAARP